MSKLTDNKSTHSYLGVTRRDFLQASTAGTLAIFAAGCSKLEGAGKEEAEGSLRAVEKAGQKHLLWQPTTGLNVHVLPPEISATSDKQGRGPLPITVQLAAFGVQEDRANFDYGLMIDDGGTKRTGRYTVRYSLRQEDERAVLTQNSVLHFDEQLRLNLCAARTTQVTGKKAVTCTLPQKHGVVKDFELGEGQRAKGYFVLGRGSAVEEGEELALPVIGLVFDEAPGQSLAIAADPYLGSQFLVRGPTENAPSESSVTSSYTYMGSLVPLRDEVRTEVIVSHRGGIEGMLGSFYETIPEILPSPSWIQEVQLNYYDDISSYKSEPGQGWYHDVKKLTDKIPANHRGKVVLCVHGWYDYVGRYCYDHEKRQLDKDWDAYDMKGRKVPMSLPEMHRRLKFAKDRGFRVMLYFADGMASDTTSPHYRKDWVVKYPNGKYPRRGFWEWRPEHADVRPPGPSPMLPDEADPTNHLLDPGNPAVVDWFVGYLEALLKEYGQELDGFAWYETDLVKVGTISISGSEPTYSDRAFMRLFSRLSQLVQEWHKVNPNLVITSSDGGFAPTALVSHGTWQDSGCSPVMWPPTFLINYRNCVWSCNWAPITSESNNAFAVEKYGLPQGLSNGNADDQGPAEMPEEVLDRVVQRFLRRVSDSRERTRYLVNVLDAMTPAWMASWHAYTRSGYTQ